MSLVGLPIPVRLSSREAPTAVDGGSPTGAAGLMCLDPTRPEPSLRCTVRSVVKEVIRAARGFSDGALGHPVSLSAVSILVRDSFALDRPSGRAGITALRAELARTSILMSSDEVKVYPNY